MESECKWTEPTEVNKGIKTLEREFLLEINEEQEGVTEKWLRKLNEIETGKFEDEEGKTVETEIEGSADDKMSKEEAAHAKALL